MRGSELLDLMEYLDADLIEEADQTGWKEKRAGWLKWITGLTACMVIVIVIFLQFQDSNSEGMNMSGEVKSALSEDKGTEESGFVTVYIVDGTELRSENKETTMSKEFVFEAWKNANGIGEEVRLLSCELADNSSVLNLVVSRELEKYYENKEQELLIDSLVRTMAAFTGIKPEDCRLTLE